ncbi:hypothetical protein F0562_007066 [Nyssa sinensis]|uniref:RING-type domain-containing protein n=1 Tax=Nyssa sinensis TaxID=561372 RepID=A0A5J5A3P6_9ASTE|nr:hypothetical protein F0562_007066 [Nyssa sinensis]
MPQATFQVDQDIYREKISTAIIRHNYLFMFVEHEGIRDLHNFLNPIVKPITRNTTKSDVLKLYKREKDKLKHVIESIPSRICLTSNLWSSIETDGYLTLTAHYMDENWILQKKILSFHHMPPPHSGPILAEKVIHLLKEWGIEKKVFSLTLDNAKYNDGLIDVLKCHLYLTDTLFCGGEFFHVRCGVHILNLIVQASLKVIDEAVNKIRESVKYVRDIEGRKIKFVKCIAQLSLSCSKKFSMIQGLNEGTKNKLPVIVTATLNLPEFASATKDKELEINIPLIVSGCSIECSPSLRMPKAISITFTVNLVRYLKLMVMMALTHLGLLTTPEEAFSSENSTIYVVMLDGSSPSLVPIPVHVVTAAIKKKLPVLQYGDYLLEKRIQNEEEEKACSVCLDSIESSHEIRELCNCCHVFHRECLDSWVDEGQVTCPLCRSMLLSPKGFLNLSSCAVGGEEQVG